MRQLEGYAYACGIVYAIYPESKDEHAMNDGGKTVGLCIFVMWVRLVKVG
jgi:hypothetical protein